MRHILLIIWALLLAAGCSNVEFGTTQESSKSGGAGDSDDVVRVEGPQVCDPFGSDTRGEGKGLFGNLYYINPGENHPPNLATFFKDGHRSKSNIILTHLNVPVRNFSQGFSAGGSYLTDDSGQRLVEWFALRVISEIRLPASHNPGYYQFALESDDGAILSFRNASGDSQEHINNDGVHSPSTECASTPVFFDDSTKLPITVEYFQGPKTEIALVLKWRKVDSNSLDCSGSGWQPVPAESFHLPADVVDQCK